MSGQSASDCRHVEVLETADTPVGSCHGRILMLQCIRERLICANDLEYFEPRFISECFSLNDYGITPRHFAAVLHATDEQFNSIFLASLDAGDADAIRQARLGTPFDTETANTLIEEVLCEYFWHIVYRKYPHLYETFSTYQQFDLDHLFPVRYFGGMTVLDMGCGSGKLTSHLCGTAEAVVGVDCADPMLRFVREKFSSVKNARFTYGTFNNTGQVPGSFDLVVSNMAFPSSERAGGDRGIAELKRIVRPGGMIRLTVANDLARQSLLIAGFIEEVHERALQYGRIAEEMDPVVKALLCDAFFKPGRESIALSVFHWQANS
jgi:ubiquinone/menaquinone biosynthesis C-methylase UbiE